MITKLSTFLLPTFIFLGAVLHPTVAVAQEFHGTSYGYYLDLPPGWIEIPKDVLDEMVAALLKQDATTTIIYDAGFQLESSDQWLEYPYILVQPLSYKALGVNRQINEDEFPRFVQMITGLDVDTIFDENVSSDIRPLLDNLVLGQPQLDVANRRYIWPLNMDVQGIGPIRGVVIGYFGRDSIVQVAFYSRSADWDQHSETGLAILKSFRFAHDKAYSIEIAAANPTPPSFWQRILGKGMIGAIAGGIAAAVFVGIKQKKKAGST